MRSAGRTIKLFFRLYISVDTSNLHECRSRSGRKFLFLRIELGKRVLLDLDLVIYM